jgi:hypothetical protein
MTGRPAQDEAHECDKVGVCLHDGDILMGSVAEDSSANTAVNMPCRAWMHCHALSPRLKDGHAATVIISLDVIAFIFQVFPLFSSLRHRQSFIATRY